VHFEFRAICSFQSSPQPLRFTQARRMSNATLEVPVSPASAVPSDRPRRRMTVLAALRRIPEIEFLVDGFVVSWHSSLASIQSRRSHRVAFQKPLVVTPLDDQTEMPCGDALAVTGRDISLTGLSFIHAEPLPARKIAVTFPFDDGTAESIVMLLRWCRFRRDGFYQSGGQFLRTISVDCQTPAAVFEAARAF
jgi:hypothetical protein